jgi:hypothetical protein
MGYVYLIGDREKEGIYKIGVTRGNVDKRIKKLQTGNCGEIFLVKQYETDFPFVMEKMLHTKFYSDKVLNEWFSLSLDDVKEFTNTCDNIQENINALKDNYFFQKKYGKK